MPILTFAKSYKLPIFLVILTITLFFFVPTIITKLIVNTINHDPNYHVQIGSVTLNPLNASITIRQFDLTQNIKNTSLPLLKVNKIEFSIEGAKLLRGHLVTKIIAYQPEVNLSLQSQAKSSQNSIDKNWKIILDPLRQLQLNSIAVIKGKIIFKEIKKDDAPILWINDINASFNNLRNASGLKNALPSSFEINANSIGNGSLHLTGHVDTKKPTPTFEFEGFCNHLQLPKVNALINYYTQLSVKKGLFSVHIASKGANGLISGSVQPNLKNLELHEVEKSSSTIVSVYKSAIEMMKQVFQNPKTKALSTKIIINGKIENPHTSTFSVISYLISNAFTDSLFPQLSPEKRISRHTHTQT